MATQPRFRIPGLVSVPMPPNGGLPVKQKVLPPIKTKRTPPDHWLNLPRRKCDFCGASYKPTQPFKKGQKYSFCGRPCKERFHAKGGAYAKALHDLIKEIKRQVRLYERCPICHARPRRKPCIHCEASGYLLTEYGRDLKTFIEWAVQNYLLNIEQQRNEKGA